MMSQFHSELDQCPSRFLIHSSSFHPSTEIFPVKSGTVSTGCIGPPNQSLFHPLGYHRVDPPETHHLRSCVWTHLGGASDAVRALREPLASGSGPCFGPTFCRFAAPKGPILAWAWDGLHRDRALGGKDVRQRDSHGPPSAGDGASREGAVPVDGPFAAGDRIRNWILVCERGFEGGAPPAWARVARRLEMEEEGGGC